MENKQIIVFASFQDFEELIENIIRRVLDERLQMYQEGLSSKENDIIGIEGACKITDLAKPTIYGLVSNRKIPFFKQGKKLRFRKTELIEWIEAGRKKTVSQLKDAADQLLSRINRK